MKLFKNDPEEITKGPVAKGILHYFFPIFIGSLFQQLYNMVDTVVVGKFVGTNALAAVGGSAGQIAIVTMWLFSGLSSGPAVTASQHYGAMDREGVHRDIHNAYALSIISGGAFTALGFLFIKPLLNLMRTDTSLMGDSLIYLRVIFAGLVFSVIFNMGSGILRALGDSVRPLYYLIICCAINIVLDIAFVIIIPMGVLGAAVATIAAQGVSAVLVTYRIMRLDDAYRLKIRKIRVYPAVMKIQLKIGIPGAFQSSLYGIANMTIQSFVNTLSNASVAAFAAFLKIDALYWMVSGAFGVAVTTYAGQNYGAGNMKRVRESAKASALMCALIGAFISFIVVVLRELLYRIFTDDPAVIEVGKQIILGMVPFYSLYVGVEILSGTLRGLGDVGIPMIITLSGICVLRIIWMFVLMPVYQSMDIVIAVYPISWGVTSLLFIIYYLYKRKSLGIAEN